MRICLLLLVLFSSANDLFSQSQEETHVKYKFGITPSALMNINPGLQVSNEFIFDNKATCGLESGFITSSSQTNNKYSKGYRLRLSFGLLLGSSDRKTELFVFYNFKKLWSNRSVSVSRANGAYTEDIDGYKIRTFSGPGVGINFDVNPMVKIGFGLGKGYVSNEFTDSRLEEYENSGVWIISNGIGSYNLPIFILHLNYTIARLNLSK